MFAGFQLGVWSELCIDIVLSYSSTLIANLSIKIACRASVFFRPNYFGCHKLSSANMREIYRYNLSLTASNELYSFLQFTSKLSFVSLSCNHFNPPQTPTINLNIFSVANKLISSPQFNYQFQDCIQPICTQQ